MIVFLKRESSFLKRESDFLGGSKDLATGQSGGDGLFAFGAHLLREPQYGCERDGSQSYQLSRKNRMFYAATVRTRPCSARWPILADDQGPAFMLGVPPAAVGLSPLTSNRRSWPTTSRPSQPETRRTPHRGLLRRPRPRLRRRTGGCGRTARPLASVFRATSKLGGVSFQYRQPLCRRSVEVWFLCHGLLPSYRREPPARELSDEVIRVITGVQQSRLMADVGRRGPDHTWRRGGARRRPRRGGQLRSTRRKSLPSLAMVARDLTDVLGARYAGEPEADASTKCAQSSDPCSQSGRPPSRAVRSSSVGQRPLPSSGSPWRRSVYDLEEEAGSVARRCRRASRIAARSATVCTPRSSCFRVAGETSERDPGQVPFFARKLAPACDVSLLRGGLVQFVEHDLGEFLGLGQER
jgi:hypothetical protein